MNRRGGFTLFELLVMIAIIAVLIALLLSAFQAARRSQCVNNMKQIGLAMHGFDDVNGKLSAGNISCDGYEIQKRWGWIPRIQPFMEQAVLTNAMNFSQASWQGSFTVLQKTWSGFLCPSDPY